MGRNMGKNTFLPGRNGRNMVETSSYLYFSNTSMDTQHVPTVNRTPAVSGLIAQINPLWRPEMTWDADLHNCSQLVLLPSLDWGELRNKYCIWGECGLIYRLGIFK